MYTCSHTAGAVRIGLMAGQLCNYDPIEVKVLFHGSLASTYSFHKTDVGVIAGVLGMVADDERIRYSIEIAEEKNIKVSFGKIDIKGAHPSTILIKPEDKDQNKYIVKSATVGGGYILIQEVNGIEFESNGKQYDILLDLDSDDSDAVETIIKTEIGTEYKIRKNTATNKKTIDIVSTEKIDNQKIDLLKSLEDVNKVYCFEPIMAMSNTSIVPFQSVEELVNMSIEDNCSISDSVIKFECINSGRTEEEVIGEMKSNFIAMREAIKNGSSRDNKMLANIFGGNAKK